MKSIERARKLINRFSERTQVLTGLALVCLTGIFLRVLALRHQAVWYDEVVTIIDAKQPVLDIIKHHAASAMEPHPPLYYILLHYWMLLFGSGEVAIRSLSVISGVLAVPFIYILAKKIIGRKGAMIATILLVVSPFHVYYSQEARMYALVFLLSILSTLCMLWMLEGRKFATIGFIVTSLISIYLLYYAGLLLIAQNIFVFAFYWRKTGILKKWLLAQALVAIGYLPWLVVFYNQLAYRTAGTASQFTTTIKMPINTLIDFSIGSGHGILVLIISGVLYGVIFVAAVGQAKKDSRYRAAPLILFAVPILLAIAISLKTNFYVTRGLIVALFAYLILLASGVIAFKSRAVQAILLSALLLFSLHSLYAYYFDITPISDPSIKYINLRDPALYIKERAQGNDAVLNDYVMCYYPFVYYFGDDRNQFLLSKSDNIQHLKESFLEANTGSSKAVAEKHKRIWLVQLKRGRPGEPWLDKNARVVSKKTFYGVRIRLYEVKQP